MVTITEIKYKNRPLQAMQVWAPDLGKVEHNLLLQKINFYDEWYKHGYTHIYLCREVNTVYMTKGYDYRILTPDGRIKYTGGNSWLRLDEAKELVQPGEMIYYYENGQRLFEIL